MKYLSLFSGVEAATLAWEPLGWEAVAFAQFDPENNYEKGTDFPSAVLRHRWPNVPNLGDVSKITQKQIKDLGQIDLIVFGSPCQDLSIAGKREGLDGKKSGLFRNAMQIIKWAIKHNGCRFALWENVYGSFSSNKGADFCEVLSSLCGSKLQQPEKWGSAGCCFGKAGLVEWATLDAQYFGVPQRRRRVFAFADFGNWEGRSPILIKSESVQRNIETSRKEKERNPPHSKACVRAGSHWDDPRNPHPTLNQSHNSGGIAMSNQETFSQRGGGLVPFDMTAFGQYGDGTTGSTCKARDHKDATDLVVSIHGTQDPDTLSNMAHTIGRNQGQENAIYAYPIHNKATRHAGLSGRGSGNGLGIGKNNDPSPTLTTADRHAICIQGPLIGRSHKNGPQGSGLNKEISFTLNTVDLHAVCIEEQKASHQNERAEVGKSNVRRLTPMECERLQGMPDNHTKIAWRGKPTDECPDGPRYQAIGNSMAVPVMRWIGEQINTII
ncbi:TPA: DNA cytosine methyltransferase [Vibrio parahaemolyticus]